MRANSWFVTLVSTLVMAILLAGAAPAAAAAKAGAPKSGGTLRVGVPLDPISLDPFYSTSPSTRMVYMNIYDTLTVVDFDGQLRPSLAEKWERVADTKWRFYLRKGVKFHSGAPFTAAAVKATFDRNLDPKKPGRPATVLAPIKSTAVIDDFTVEFTTARPSALLPGLFSYHPGAIVDPSEVRKLGKDFADTPSGTGPFKLESWNKGQSVVLGRNPDYWGGAPPLEKVQFKIIPDESTRVLAYESGEIDVLYTPPGHLLGKLKQDKNTQIAEAVSWRTVYVGVNRKSPLLEDVKVRQALSYAIDRKGIADFLLEGIGAPAEGFPSPTIAGFAPVGLYPFDQAKAKALLAEAGWKPSAGGILEKGGTPLKLSLWTSPEDPKNAEIAQTIQGEMRKLGIDIAIQNWELAAYLEKLKELKHDLYIYGATASAGGLIDHTATSNFFSKGGRNYTGLANAEIDKLIASGRAEMDPAKRQEIYTRLQQAVKEEVPWIPIYHTLELAASKTFVKDFKVHPAIALDMRKVWIDK